MIALNRPARRNVALTANAAAPRACATTATPALIASQHVHAIAAGLAPASQAKTDSLASVTRGERASSARPRRVRRTAAVTERATAGQTAACVPTAGWASTAPCLPATAAKRFWKGSAVSTGTARTTGCASARRGGPEKNATDERARTRAATTGRATATLSACACRGGRGRTARPRFASTIARGTASAPSKAATWCASASPGSQGRTAASSTAPVTVAGTGCA